jgi:hypothetical protein
MAKERSMTTPEPDNLQTKVIEIIKPLIEGFAKQPPMLAYGGLVLITALLIYLAGGGLSNILLAVPIIVIFAYLILQLGMRWLDIVEKKADSQQEKPDLPQPEPPQPEPQKPTVAHKKDDVPAKEWERRYLQHLLGLCQYPPSMAL